MKSPRTVHIHITGKCNLACKHCYYASNMGKHDDLPAQDWIRFIDECGDAAVMAVTFSGGEPFIREDIFEISDAAVRNRLRMSFLSNGTLITKDIARRLGGIPRLMRVQVSVDGDKALHEGVRGAGTFDKALRGMEFLIQYGIMTDVSMTLTKPDAVDLKAIAQRFKEMGVRKMGVNPVINTGKASCHWEDFESVERENEVFHSKRLDLIKEYGEFIDGVKKFDIKRSINYKHRRCSVGESSISIRNDGAIIACALFYEKPLGFVNYDRLTDVWKKDPFLNKIRDGFYNQNACVARAFSKLEVM